MSADSMLSVFVLVPGLNLKVPLNIFGPYFCMVVGGLKGWKSSNIREQH